MALETIEEIEDYAIRMRKRGDTYSEINSFLKKNWHNESQIDSLVKRVKAMEKRKELIVVKAAKEYSMRNLIIGGIVFLLGFFLFLVLRRNGFVATVTLIMMGAGLFGMFKKA